MGSQSITYWWWDFVFAMQPQEEVFVSGWFVVEKDPSSGKDVFIAEWTDANTLSSVFDNPTPYEFDRIVEELGAYYDAKSIMEDDYYDAITNDEKQVVMDNLRNLASHSSVVLTQYAASDAWHAIETWLVQEYVVSLWEEVVPTSYLPEMLDEESEVIEEVWMARWDDAWYSEIFGDSEDLIQIEGVIFGYESLIADTFDTLLSQLDAWIDVSVAETREELIALTSAYYTALRMFAQQDGMNLLDYEEDDRTRTIREVSWTMSNVYQEYIGFYRYLQQDTIYVDELAAMSDTDLGTLSLLWDMHYDKMNAYYTQYAYMNQISEREMLVVDMLFEVDAIYDSVTRYTSQSLAQEKSDYVNYIYQYYGV